MSDIFFSEFHLQKPDYCLEIGSHSHSKQTSLMMIEIEKILLEVEPVYLVVYGDTNSTLAGALVATKLDIKTIHIEAGLRSFNMNMPEEPNRMITDRISDILFAPSQLAMDNLKQEGLENNSFFVGDLMKDLLFHAKHQNLIKTESDKEFYYSTIHRPYNTDHKKRLSTIFEVLDNLHKPVVFSLHPRTKHLSQSMDIRLSNFKNIQFIEPVSYVENLNYIHNASALLTDSGGMQKEAYWLKTKCITIRKETEWSETLQGGWNNLVFDKLEDIKGMLRLTPGQYYDSLYGDGRAAENIIAQIKNLVSL